MHREIGVLGVHSGGVGHIFILYERVDRVEGARDIIGFILNTGVQLWHVGHVDPTIVPESDTVLLEREGLALEDNTVQLNRIRHELRVHLFAVPKEVL